MNTVNDVPFIVPAAIKFNVGNQRSLIPDDEAGDGFRNVGFLRPPDAADGPTRLHWTVNDLGAHRDRMFSSPAERLSAFQDTLVCM